MRRIVLIAIAILFAFAGAASAQSPGDRVTYVTGTTARSGTLLVETSRLDLIARGGTTSTQDQVDPSVVKPVATPTPTPSPTETPTATPSPTETPTPSPTSSPTPTSTPAPAVTVQPVDGGPGYYGNFANPLPTSSSFFPIGVWGAYNQTQANMDLDAAAGLNTYVWAADSAFMSAIRADGRFNVIQDQGSRSTSGSETKGWLLGDEADMSASATCPSALTSAKQGLDGRLKFANYGKGLALAPGDAQADPPGVINWWADTAEANCWANGVDVASDDFYWFTDPFDGASNRYGYLYGTNVRNLRRADGSDGVRHPIWGFVETGWPFTESAAQGGRAILPAELRSAAWHSIIAGARGIIWFEHSFGGPHAGDHHTIRSNSEGTRPMVTSVDAQIKQLAPVLNSPSVTSGWSATGGVKTMVKWDGTHFYVFMGAMTAATTATFSMPCVGSATAANQGEMTGSLSIPVTGGQFSDFFADKNAVHVYEIDGGSPCGLAS